MVVRVVVTVVEFEEEQDLNQVGIIERKRGVRIVDFELMNLE